MFIYQLLVITDATEERGNITKFLRNNTIGSNEINVGVQLELYI